MSQDAADRPGELQSGLDPLRTFVATFAAVSVLGVLWALSTPLFTAPDEPAHAVRAVATWTGDAGGTIRWEDGIRVKEYDVPSPYEESQGIALCTALKPDQTADCGPAFDGDGTVEVAPSTAGFYPPLFYWMVGWGGAVADSSGGMYLMRSIHALVCAVLIGLAAASSVRRGGSALSLCGLALAVTPMVVFLSGTVNSSGLEIAASIALWCSLLALVQPSLGAAARRWPDAAIAVASGLTLVFTRTLSPAYAAAIVGLVLVASPGVGPRTLLRRRDVIGTVAVLAAASIVATLAIVRSGQFDSAATSGTAIGPNDTALSYGIGYIETALRQMVAVFGWLDTGTAQLSYYCWIIACVVLVVGAILVGRARRSIAIGLTALTAIALPIAANWSQARTDGFVWQGRYTLPLAVGIPILAALAVDEVPIPDRYRRRLVVVLAVMIGVGQVYAVYWALRRFAVGVDGPLVFLDDAAWAPPVLGIAGTMLLAVAAAVAIGVLLVRSPGAVDPTAEGPEQGSGGSGEPERGPEPGDDADPDPDSGSDAGDEAVAALSGTGGGTT